jgi:beta propeller repeat protein
MVGDCCLDTDSNQICDSDEPAIPTNQTGNGELDTENITIIETEYCGDDTCNANETSSTCCTDCGCPAGKLCLSNNCVDFPGFKPMEVRPLLFCGDGICADNETINNCCTDCGCDSGQICKNNSCLYSIKPITIIPLIMLDKKISQDYVSSLSKPRIWGNLVTWTQTFNTKQQVMLYNIQTNKLSQLTNLSKNCYYPDVSGLRMVWEDRRRPTGQENSDTYLYDIANGVEGFVTSRIGYKRDQSIDGNLIAWTEAMGTDGDVYLFDLSTSTEKKLTQGDLFPVSTDISGPNVVWGYYKCATYPCKYGISSYNIFTKQTTNLFESESVIQYTQVRIHGNNVVYIGGQDEHEQVFVYNLATKINTQLTTALGEKFGPAIYNNTVVWSDERNGNWDIYSYDLVKKQETAITTDEDDQKWPDVYSNKVVYQGSGDALHIYVHTLSS